VTNCEGLVCVSSVDYIYGLKGIKYPSDEYKEKRSEVGGWF